MSYRGFGMEYYVNDFNPSDYDGMADISGNGKTTLMVHNKTGEQVVRKEINGINRELYRRLMNVRHDNLIRILGIEETETGCRTYEEYINGNTLAEMLANGPVPEETAIQWIGQLCSAVRVYCIAVCRYSRLLCKIYWLFAETLWRNRSPKPNKHNDTRQHNYYWTNGLC